MLSLHKFFFLSICSAGNVFVCLFCLFCCSLPLCMNVFSLPSCNFFGGEGEGVVFGPPPNHFSNGPSTNNVNNVIILWYYW